MEPRDLLTSLISSFRNETPPEQTLIPPSSNPLLNASDSIRKTLLTLHALFPHELLPALDLLDRTLITRLTLTPNQNAETQNNTTQIPSPLPPGPLPPRTEQTRAPTERRELRTPLRRPPQNTIPIPQAPHQSPQSQIPAPSSRAQIPHPDDQPHLGGQNPPLHPESSAPEDSARAPAHPRHADAYLVRSGQLPARVRADAVGVRIATYGVRLEAWTCSCPAFAFAAFPATERGRRDGRQRQDWQGKEWRFGGLTIGEDIPVCKHLLACVLVEHSEVFAGLVEEREVSEAELAGRAAGWGD